MATDHYRVHAEQVQRTTTKQVSAARVGWCWAVTGAAILTVCLGLLTFNVLAAFLLPVIAILLAVAIHAVAVIAVHHTVTRSKPRPLWLLGAALMSVVAYILAYKRALLWFEGTPVLAALLALIEPAAIWILGAVTAHAHKPLDSARDHQRRARELVHATSQNDRPARTWATKVRQVRDELRAIERSPAESEREIAQREEHANHVRWWLRLLETYATAEHADQDDQAEWPNSPSLRSLPDTSQPPMAVRPSAPHLLAPDQDPECLSADEVRSVR